MNYKVHQAKTHLSRLIEEAENGKEVTISRGDKPAVKLVPIEQAPTRRVPDELKGQISYTPDAFDPLTDEEMKELGFE